MTSKIFPDSKFMLIGSDKIATRLWMLKCLYTKYIYTTLQYIFYTYGYGYGYWYIHALQKITSTTMCYTTNEIL